MTAALPLVTIGIPTYNRAASYLPEALDCARAQAYPNLEIVVSDNCSTDHTRELVEGCGDARVRYFRQAHGVRPNDNFNFCLTQARGDYFLLLLDDEHIDRDFVATCLGAAHYRRDVGLLRTGLRTIDANGVVIDESPNAAGGLAPGDLFLAWFAGGTRFYLCNTLFNTRLLRDVGGFNSRHALFQDVMALVRVAARAERIDVEAVKASTRSHPGQYTYSAKVSAWAEDSLDLLALMCDLAPDRRDAIWERGSRFFAMINYSRASGIRSPVERAAAYRSVYVLFGRRHTPPARMVFGSTALYRGLRALKRRLKRQPAWAAAG